MEDREMTRRWVETWKFAAPELEAIRRKEIREADNLQVLASLEGAFKSRAADSAAAGILGDGGNAKVAG
jgi:hypothetical protein